MSGVSTFLADFLLGFFLLLVVFKSARYLIEWYGLSGNWGRIPPSVFILLSLGICGLSGVFLIALGPQQALLAFALGAGVCLSLFHPVAATSIFVAALLLRPWEEIQNNVALDAVPRLLAGVAIGSWILSRFLRRRMTFVWNRWLGLFTALLCWLLISAFVSPYSDLNLQFVTRAFLPFFIVCLLLVNSLETPRDVELLKQSLTLSLTGVVATAIVWTVGNPEFFVHGARLKGRGYTGNPNDLAALAVLALPFLGLSCARRLKQRKLPGLDLFCIAILGVGLLMTKSRAGVIALAVVFAFYLFMVSKSVVRVLMWMMLASPLVLVFAMFAMRRSQSDLQGSSESRWNYIVSAFRMLKVHPFMGVGVNNFPRFYDQYSLLFLETGEHTVHSTWMLFLAETGPIGLALFSVLFFSMAARAWRMRFSSPEFFLAMLGYGITMTFLSHSYSFFPYLLIFLTASAYRVTRTEESETQWAPREH